MGDYEIEVDVTINGQNEKCYLVFDLQKYYHASEDPNSFGSDPERRKYIKEVIKKQLEDGQELTTSLHAIKRELDEALEEYEYNQSQDMF